MTTANTRPSGRQQHPASTFEPNFISLSLLIPSQNKWCCEGGIGGLLFIIQSLVTNVLYNAIAYSPAKK